MLAGWLRKASEGLAVQDRKEKHRSFSTRMFSSICIRWRSTFTYTRRMENSFCRKLWNFPPNKNMRKVIEKRIRPQRGGNRASSKRKFCLLSFFFKWSWRAPSSPDSLGTTNVGWRWLQHKITSSMIDSRAEFRPKDFLPSTYSHPEGLGLDGNARLPLT